MKILDAISAGEPPSPTDFMMSVHNAAAGMFTIEGRVHAPASSVGAGAESFHMALVEAAGMLADGMDCVAVVDFDDCQRGKTLFPCGKRVAGLTSTRQPWWSRGRYSWPASWP